MRNHGLFVLALAMVVLAVPARADLDQGMTYYKSGKYLEAAAEFQALVDQSPSYDFGYYMMGVSFLKMGKPADAETNLTKAIELNGDKFEYHHALAKAYFDQKQYPKTIATLRSAEGLAADQRTQFALYHLRGVSYAVREKWSDAIDDLEKARAIKATPDILDRLGSAYYELGHNDKALPVLRETVVKAPGNTAMLARLTNVLINLGTESESDAKKLTYYKEALASAEKYQAKEPSSPVAHNLVGRAALGSKNWAKAEQAFRKVLALDAGHCYAMTNLGKTYIAQERWPEAETILMDAAECDAKSPVVYESLGFARQKQKKLDEAIVAYEKSLQLKPSESVKNAISICKKNIEIGRDNEEMARQEQAQKEAEAQAQREYEAAKAKQEEWKKKKEQDD